MNGWTTDDVNSVDVTYRSYFLTDVQALPEQDWVLAYSTPSFRTFHNPSVQSELKGNSPNPMPYQPGWLAIHDQITGEDRGLHKLNVTETLNVIPSTTAPPIDFYTGWFSYAIPQGGVEMYPVKNTNGNTALVQNLRGGPQARLERSRQCRPIAKPQSGDFRLGKRGTGRASRPRRCICPKVVAMGSWAHPTGSLGARSGDSHSDS